MEAIQVILKQAKVKVVKEATVGPQTVFVVNCGEKKAARIASLIRRQTDYAAAVGHTQSDGTLIWCAPESLNPFKETGIRS